MCAPSRAHRALFSVWALRARRVAAAVLGYFMIYGRLSGVFFGIVTLAVTLAFAAFMHQTAGPEWKIGDARLNGFNGMPPLGQCIECDADIE